MSLRGWDERVVPRLTDWSLRGHEVGELRQVACEGLSGRVEINFGSGLNVRWYPPDVTSVNAVEPSDVGWEISGRRRDRSAVPIERGALDGQHLDLEDGSHDHALVTFSLCTIPDPLLALQEARRVARPGGRLHALEHGLAPEESVEHAYLPAPGASRPWTYGYRLVAGSVPDEARWVSDRGAGSRRGRGR